MTAIPSTRADRDRGARRVVRGGSWINDARDARAAKRNATDPLKRNSNIGFRLSRPP